MSSYSLETIKKLISRNISNGADNIFFYLLQQADRNDTEIFYQSAKPTLRRDGSSLVAGDLWWNKDSFEKSFWNGTYWLSSELYQQDHKILGSFNSTSNPNFPRFHLPDRAVFLTSFSVEGSVDGSIGSNGNFRNITASLKEYPTQQYVHTSTNLATISPKSSANGFSNSVPLSYFIPKPQRGTELVYLGNGNFGYTPSVNPAFHNLIVFQWGYSGSNAEMVDPSITLYYRLVF